VLFCDKFAIIHWKLIIVVALEMRIVLSVNEQYQINQMILTVTIRKSQLYALYSNGIKHKICFIIKLNHLVPKDENNNCVSAVLRNWNEQQSSHLLIWK